VTALKQFDHLLARFGLGEASDLHLELVQALRSGHLCIDCDEDPKSESLVYRNGKLYLKAMDRLEEEIAEGLMALTRANIAPIEAPADAQLNPEQKAAFERVLNSPFTMITGGPGTGKSFTIEAIVKAFVGRRVLVAAPTGKAIMQLGLRLENSHAQFLTLHRALGMSLPYTIPLDFDLVIIDEASMVDAHLWAALFKAYLPCSRLVIVGDPNQLPPVECGHLFAEMTQLLPSYVIELKQCLRTDRKELIELGAALLHGEMPPDRFFTEDRDVFDRYAMSWETIEQAQLGRRVILCPLRKGSEGVNAINARLAKKHVGRYVPVLLTKNHGPLVNGEMGLGFLGAGGLESVYFRGERFDAAPVELGFCISVHKAQGSEFDSVLLAFPKGSERFGKAALYTAVTRAKSSVEFFGSKESIAEALKTEVARGSGLEFRVGQGGQKQRALSDKGGLVLPRGSWKKNARM